MVDDVRITEIAFSNKLPKWATEKAFNDLSKELKALVKELSKKSPNNSNNKSQKKIQEDYIKQLRELSGVTEDSVDTMEEFADKLSNSSDSTKKATQSLKDSMNLGSTNIMSFSGVTNLAAGAFDKLLSPVGLMIGAVGLASTAVLTFKDYIVETSNAFLNIYDTGIVFQKGMFDFRLAATQAALPLNEFSRIIVENSALVASFGDDGGRALGQISKSTRNLLQAQGMYGTSLNELNDYVVGYLETQRMLGVLNNLTVREREQQSAEYIKNLTLFSQVLGKSRRMIDEEVKATSRRVDVYAKLATLPDDIRTNATETFTGVAAAFSGAFGDSADNFLATFGDLVVNINDYQSDFIKVLAQNNPKLASEIIDLANAVGEGTINQQDANDRVVNIIEGLRDITPAQRQAISLLIESQSGFSQGAMELSEVLRQAGSISQDAMNRLQTGQEATLDEFSLAVKRLEETFRQVRSKFSEVFANFIVQNADSLEKIATDIANYAQEFAGYLKVGLDKVSELFDPEKRDAAWAEIKSVLISSVSDFISSMFDLIFDVVRQKIDPFYRSSEEAKAQTTSKTLATSEFARISREGSPYTSEQIRTAREEFTKALQMKDFVDDMGDLIPEADNIIALENMIIKAKKMGVDMERILGPIFQVNESFKETYDKILASHEQGLHYATTKAGLKVEMAARGNMLSLPSEPAIASVESRRISALNTPQMAKYNNVAAAGVNNRKLNENMSALIDKLNENKNEPQQLMMDRETKDLLEKQNKKLEELVIASKETASSTGRMYSESEKSNQNLKGVKRAINSSSNIIK